MDPINLTGRYFGTFLEIVDFFIFEISHFLFFWVLFWLQHFFFIFFWVLFWLQHFFLFFFGFYFGSSTFFLFFFWVLFWLQHFFFIFLENIIICWFNLLIFFLIISLKKIWTRKIKKKSADAVFEKFIPLLYRSLPEHCVIV